MVQSGRSGRWHLSWVFMGEVGEYYMWVECVSSKVEAERSNYVLETDNRAGI